MMNNLLSNFINDFIPVLLAFLIILISVFSVKALINLNKWSMRRIDKMNGDDFENFIKYVYELLGYTVEKTKKSGDQGIDLIVKKYFKKTGIQLKRYSGKVGNFAVQEAVAGKKYYKLDKVCVLTNSEFTRSAIDLAKANKVDLIDRSALKKMIEKAKKQEKKHR